MYRHYQALLQPLQVRISTHLGRREAPCRGVQACMLAQAHTVHATTAIGAVTKTATSKSKNATSNCSTKRNSSNIKLIKDPNPQHGPITHNSHTQNFNKEVSSRMVGLRDKNRQTLNPKLETFALVACSGRPWAWAHQSPQCRRACKLVPRRMRITGSQPLGTLHPNVGVSDSCGTPFESMT